MSYLVGCSDTHTHNPSMKRVREGGMTRQAGAMTQLCVLRESEGVDPIVCVNKPSHSVPV